MANYEFDLVESTKIIINRRFFILGVTAVSALGAVLFSFLLPPKHEATLIIEPGTRIIENSLGNIVEEKPFESPEVIKQKVLSGVFSRTIRNSLDLTEDEYPEEKAIVPKGTNVVVISVIGENPDTAVAILREMGLLISEEINQKIEIETEGLKNRIKLADISMTAFFRRAELLTRQIVDIKKKILQLAESKKNSLKSGPDSAMSVLLYSNEIQDQQQYINNLERELEDSKTQQKTFSTKIENLKFQLSKIKSVKILQEPFFPKASINKMRIVIAAIFLIIGFIGSIIYVFVLEIYRRQLTLREN